MEQLKPETPATVPTLVPVTVTAPAAETKQVGVVTKVVTDVNMTERLRLLFGAESSSGCHRQDQ